MRNKVNRSFSMKQKNNKKKVKGAYTQKDSKYKWKIEELVGLMMKESGTGRKFRRCKTFVVARFEKFASTSTGLISEDSKLCGRRTLLWRH